MAGLKKAVSKYRAFHGKNPRYTRKLKFHVPDKLIYLGEAHKVEYISDKLNGGGDGKPCIYVHKFKKGAKLYQDETGKRQLYIIGPQIYVNHRGVVN